MDSEIVWPKVVPTHIVLKLTPDEFRIIARRMTDHVPESNVAADLSHLIKGILTSIDHN